MPGKRFSKKQDRQAKHVADTYGGGKKGSEHRLRCRKQAEVEEEAQVDGRRQSRPT